MERSRLSLNKKSQIQYITREPEASLKLYKREPSSTIDLYKISKLSIYTLNKITEAYPSKCIEGVTSACFLTDCACSLCPVVNLYHTQTSLKTELLMSRLTDSPFLCFLFMAETMLNHHQPTLITASLGSGKAQVNSAPVRHGSLSIRRLDLSWMLMGKPDGRHGC
jgi:hypothetical protein